MQSSLQRCVTGMLAGMLATVPMTLWMLAGKRRLPLRSQDPLPPAQITGQVLRAVQLHDDLSRDQKLIVTTFNHFTYGAGAGTVYGGAYTPRSMTDAIVSGVTYGLGIWAGSYLGWLPAVGLYRSPARETRERHALMIGAHIVWGGSLGLLLYGLTRRARNAETDELEGKADEHLRTHRTSEDESLTTVVLNPPPIQSSVME